MSQSLDRRLTMRETFIVRLHLYACVWCEWYMRELRALHSAARERDARTPVDTRASEPHLSERARDRIRNALRDRGR
jgi:hypothetical protein